MLPEIIYEATKYLTFNQKLKLRRVSKYVFKNIFFNKKELQKIFSVTCHFGNKYRMLHYLNNKYLDPSMHDSYSLLIACRHGHLDIVQKLLKDERIDPIAANALQGAVQNDHFSIVEYLLKNDKIDPSINDNSAIFIAYIGRNLDIVQILLEDERVQKSINPYLHNKCINFLNNGK